MADWATISSLATAGGTLVLAVATFSAVKSSNRSARVAERALLAGLRPVLVPSREEDPPEHVSFGDRYKLTVPGHSAVLDVAEGNVYMAIALRNGGSGPAVIHGWHTEVLESEGVGGAHNAPPPPPIERFRRQQRDLYIPAGDCGFWQGAIRDQQDPALPTLVDAVASGRRVMIDLLYGDHEGGQRTIARFGVTHFGGESRRAEVLRYWNIDREDPR